MSKAFWAAGPLKPDIRLAQALSEFEASLSLGDKARLRSCRIQSQNTPPTIDDVMRLTAEVEDQARKNLSSGRCFGPRFSSMLHVVQQFVSLGDIVIGGSQNLIACGVWSVVRITILAATLSSSGIERLSLLFMAAGRSAPRYQGLALVYARSRLIRDYLAEYMIIVVQMCHYFHDFSRKSTIGQITSPLSESKVRNAEEELKRWTQLIKDEADFLLAQTTENEATENRNIRNRLSRSIKSNFRQQQMDRRLQWLAAFSTFDYETPWKQARKRGSSSFFVDVPSYKHWKHKESPRSLLLSGKMGCGKSVVMANMVDDLSISCPEDAVIYFFCRHDIPESLSARTVFGSFAAQMSQRHIGTDAFDEIFMNSVPSLMDLDRVLEIIPTMIKRIQGVRLLLDGADECPEEEFDLIQSGLLSLSAECNILSCISYRDQADGLQAKMWSAGEGVIMSIPDDNPDIAGFIEAELQLLKESGKLSVGDPSLLITIREALVQGADGMFLWVALQMDTICAEKTDYLIRRALHNLPKSLSGTFRRILDKSRREGRCYQRDILKILVGAKRPLTVAEFREALSVTPGDTSWDPRKMINNIYSTLACCSSLVIIDEEEGTVRLLHQSVVQFLLAAGPDSMEWSFTAQEANTYLGQIIVTYLNYGIFDKRVSTRVVPQIHAGGAASTIVTQTLNPFGTLGRKLSGTVMRRQKPSNLNIGRVLFKIQSAETASGEHVFLEYSSENFLSHTSRMIHASFLTLRLFRRLLLSHPQYTSWLEDVQPSVESDALRKPVISGSFSMLSDGPSQVPYQPDVAPNISPQLQWAISNSHSLAFSMSIREKLGLKALLSIIRYLKYMMDTGRQLKLASHMCDILLRITTLFRCDKPTNWLITTHQYSLDRYLELLRGSSWYGYPTFQWAVVRDCFQDLRNVVNPLLEEAITHKDLPTARSLLRNGASMETYQVEPPLQTAMRFSSSNPEYLLLVFQMHLTTMDLNICKCSSSDLDGFLSGLSRSVNPRIILGYASERDDQPLIELISAGKLEMSTYNCNKLLHKPFYDHSREPFEILNLLSINWLCYNQSYEVAMGRAVQLKDWRLALEISRFLETRFLVYENLLESYMTTREADGVMFILEYTKPTQKMLEKSDDGNKNYALFAPMASDWDSLEDCYELTKFSVSIQDISLHLTQEAKDNWLIKEDNDLVLSFSQRVLQYLIDEGPISEAHLLTTSTDLQASVLFHLNTLLEEFSGSFTFSSGWFDMAKTVLQHYRLMTSHLTTFRYHLPTEEISMTDQIHVLRSSFMRIAETLLRKRHAAWNQQSPDADWSNMIEDCFEDWYPDATMETLLRLCGFQRTMANLEGRYSTLSARHTMPLGWEAFAAGRKVAILFRDNDIALSQIEAADLCLSSQPDWLEETWSTRTVQAWRAGSSE